MSNYPVIKAVLIAVIWITILIRGTLVMAQHTTDFFNVAQIAAACTFDAGPIAGQLVESYSGGDTTSLVAGIFDGTVKGLPGQARIDCNSPTGTYAIITSPQFVPGSSTSDITSIVTTGITTLYRSESTANFSIGDPFVPMLSVVGDGKTESRSTPILLTDNNNAINFNDPTWFLIGMEILLNRQGAPSGEFTFQSSLTLIPN